MPPVSALMGAHRLRAIVMPSRSGTMTESIRSSAVI
jgi:hypothetical protein